MRVKTAVLRAAKAAIDPDNDGDKAAPKIHFLFDDPTSWVVAQTACYLLAIRVDVQVPTFSLLAKHAKEQFGPLQNPITASEKDGVVTFFDALSRLQYAVGGQLWRVPDVSFPEDLKPEPKFREVLAVASAAAEQRDPVRQLLKLVRFGVDGVSASDESSIAFSPLSIGTGQLFFGQCFEKWPKGQTSMRLEKTRAFFQCKDELRIVPAYDGVFPPLRRLVIPDYRYTYRLRFSQKELREAMTACLKDRCRSVCFDFNSEGVKLTSKVASFSVPALEGRAKAVQVWVDGKRVQRLLKTLPAAHCWVLFSNGSQPLRFRAGGYTEDVYPLQEV